MQISISGITVHITCFVGEKKKQ